VDVVPPLVADREPAVLRKPGQRALHDPPVTLQPLARVDSASGDAWGYAPPSQGFSTTREVVSPVGVEPVGTLPRSAGTATRPPDRLDAIHGLLQDLRVVDVRGGEHYRKWEAPRSETRWRFESAFPLSVGFAPVFAPPFWQGC
jgi:hypothetical protein